MARNEKRRQKALMKKRRKEKDRKEKRRAGTFNPSDPASYHYRKSLIKRARGFPIFECLINPDWREQGLARLLVSRKQQNSKLIIGVFLVDIFCLGLKNTFCNADISIEDYKNNLKTQVYEDASPINCHPRLAHRIIYGAIDYAEDLGFKPQKDFRLSRFILDEPSEVDLSFDVKFGKDGKPCYVSGPDDDVNYIMRKLSKRLGGEDNFNFITPLEM